MLCIFGIEFESDQGARKSDDNRQERSRQHNIALGSVVINVVQSAQSKELYWCEVQRQYPQISSLSMVDHFHPHPHRIPRSLFFFQKTTLLPEGLFFQTFWNRFVNILHTNGIDSLSFTCAVPIQRHMCVKIAFHFVEESKSRGKPVSDSCLECLKTCPKWLPQLLQPTSAPPRRMTWGLPSPLTKDLEYASQPQSLNLLATEYKG